MLTKRLEKLISVLPFCRVLADVGCDHGYVGIEALKRGLAGRAVFVDISNECLAKAHRNCPKGLIERCEFVCQDGIGQIKADAAAICGMGGLEIISILDNAETLPDALVLQPMRNARDVREKLSACYDVTSDEKIWDGKFYDVITAVKREGGCKLTEAELEFGRSNVNNPSADFVAYLEHERNKLNAIAAQCGAREVTDRLDAVCKILEEIRR